MKRVMWVLDSEVSSMEIVETAGLADIVATHKAIKTQVEYGGRTADIVMSHRVYAECTEEDATFLLINHPGGKVV